MKFFTLRINLILVFFLTATLGMAQDTYQTVGIIGIATPNGWNASAPMKLANTSDTHQQASLVAPTYRCQLQVIIQLHSMM